MDNYRWPYLLSIIFFISYFSSCTHNEKQVTKSYYFWRADDVSEEEKKFLKQHGIHKLYAKLMDVDWNDVYGAYPVAPVNLNDLSYDLNQRDSLSVNVVPVIFITNKTFIRIDSADIPSLAKRIVRRCLPAYDHVDISYESKEESRTYWPNYSPLTPTEIQFDCDWTVSTAKKYFYFLKTINSLLQGNNVSVSATIRLHQFKYPSKTGVPPVDRGMLMVYNISDLTRHAASNSIFDVEKAGAYFTSNKKYPLPMDIALPAYSWGIIFRNKQFYQIENQLSEDDLKKCSFLKQAPNHFYTVTQDTVFNNLFLRVGDEVKMEGINSKSLNEAAELSRKAVNADSFSIAFFELSENEIKNYSYETIQAVYNAYR